MTESLAIRLGELLAAKQERLVVAESCTGGAIAAQLTLIPGSSAYIDRAFVPYSNTAKTEMLGVDQELIMTYGSVSLEIAAAMAHGALLRGDATVALAVTGVAGPGGGSPHKPVGTVCFAWTKGDDRTRTEKRQFQGDRRQVREQTVRVAIERALELINEWS